MDGRRWLCLRKATRVTDQQRLAEQLTATRFSRRFPVLLGGDCSIVLGPLLALRRRGRYGLAFLDGTPTSSIPATSRTVRSHRST
jgi:hypothetical protein